MHKGHREWENLRHQDLYLTKPQRVLDLNGIVEFKKYQIKAPWRPKIIYKTMDKNKYIWEKQNKTKTLQTDTINSTYGALDTKL